MGKKDILGDDLPNQSSNVDGEDGESDVDTGLEDKYGNPPDPELHRKSTKDGKKWFTYEKDGQEYLMPKKGKADECKRRANQREQSTEESKIEFNKTDDAEDESIELEDRLREQAENQVENITSTCKFFLGDQWEPKDQERERLIQAQTELIKRYPEASGVPMPWYVKWGYAWGMYVKVRVLGGPDGVLGIVDLYSRFMAPSDEEDDLDDEDLDEATGDESGDERVPEEDSTDNEPPGKEKYGL